MIFNCAAPRFMTAVSLLYVLVLLLNTYSAEFFINLDVKDRCKRATYNSFLYTIVSMQCFPVKIVLLMRISILICVCN